MKKITEKNLNPKDWTEASSEEYQKTLNRNAKMRAERENKSATVTFRIVPSDLELLNMIAGEKGLKYQTLLGQVIHEFVLGKLVHVENQTNQAIIDELIMAIMHRLKIKQKDSWDALVQASSKPLRKTKTKAG